MGHVGVSKHVKKRAYRLSNNKCIYCGGSENLSIEHVIPYAVFTWGSEPFEEKEVNDSRNVFVACRVCNYAKAEKILLEEDILGLKLSKDILGGILDYREEQAKRISKYLGKKSKVWRRQNKKCYNCGRKVDFNDCSLRRRISDMPRLGNNAVIVCQGCNRTFRHIQNRKKKNKLG